MGRSFQFFAYLLRCSTLKLGVTEKKMKEKFVTDIAFKMYVFPHTWGM